MSEVRTVRLQKRSLQGRVVYWHEGKFPNSDPFKCVTKCTEELGELARAILAKHEGRAGRGDVAQEAGQAVLTILALVGRFFPEIDVLAEVEKEIERLTMKWVLEDKVKP